MPKLPSTVHKPGMTVGADERRICMGRGDDAPGTELLEHLGQALGVSQTDTSIKQAIHQHLVRDDLGALDEVDDPVDIIGAGTVLHALHENGASESVRHHTRLLHRPHKRPSPRGVLAGDRIAHQGVVSHDVRCEVTAAHLAEDASDLLARTCIQEHLEVGIVGDNVDVVILRHALEQDLGRGTIVASGTSLQSAVVSRGIDRQRRAFQLFQQAHGFGHVMLAARGADHRHVVQQIRVSRLLEELAGKVVPPALDRCLDKGAVRDCVDHNALELHGLEKVTSLVPKPRMTIDLHQCGIQSEGHTSASPTDIADGVLSKAHVTSLCAERHDCRQNALRRLETRPNQLVEHFRAIAVGRGCTMTQQDLACIGGQRAAL
mmetsp:Transcript_22753/g.57981  ORF Transcript_22753/g.57981 Transcript_22753/m.57981 type:complete len:376 (+) Transcript_22753:1207-2334(+)